jgi:hypothetical protein
MELSAYGEATCVGQPFRGVEGHCGGHNCGYLESVMPGWSCRIWFFHRGGVAGSVDLKIGAVHGITLPVGEHVANAISSTLLSLSFAGCWNHRQETLTLSNWKTDEPSSEGTDRIPPSFYNGSDEWWVALPASMIATSTLAWSVCTHCITQSKDRFSASAWSRNWAVMDTASVRERSIHLLQGLEKKGYQDSAQHRDGKSLRKVYRATPAGLKALALAKNKVRELFRELIEDR